MCDLRDMKNWPACDIFLKRRPEDEQEVIAIQTVIRRKRKILCFLNLPNKVFYRLNGIHVLLTVLKVAQEQYLATQGKPKVVSRSYCTKSLARQSTLWFMVNHAFTRNWIYGKMVLPGVTGGKNTSSVTPFSVLFSVVSSPENKSRNDLQSIPYRVNINN